jgi:hypothetical protein
MGSISTAMATSFKQEVLSAGHCFNATVTPTGNASGTTTSITGMSSMAGVAVGMNVSGTNIATGTVVAAITSATAMTLSLATTGSIVTGTLTISGDTFWMALITGTPTGTFGAANVNYTDLGADEVSGTGYTATGVALGNNVSAVTSGTTAYLTFSVNPSWTSATFTSGGCMIYNGSANPRNGGTSGTNTTGAGRCCSVHSFSGSQSVTAGTFTVVWPSATSSLAVLRIS